MRLVLVSALALALAGCGYVGDPLPPALRIPMPVEDLEVLQRGSRLQLTFTLPKLTTEGLPASVSQVDVRYGPPQDGAAFAVDPWADSARRIALEPAPGGAMKVDIPIADLAGREVFVAVRTVSDRGRISGWSPVLAITVVPPLVQPIARAEATAAGVAIASTIPVAGASGWRVFRKTEEQPDFVLLAEPATLPFLDSSAEYGKLYRYVLQAIRGAAGRTAESPRSDPVSLIPEDTFPPPVPEGLNAIAGIGAIELAWEPSAARDLQGYRVYRSAAGAAWAALGELTPAPSFSDRSAQPGVDYRYSITAVDVRNNESEKSAPVTARLPQ